MSDPVQIHEAERRYASLFQNCAYAIAYCRTITDAHRVPVDAEVIEVNPAYERAVGLKKADLEGRRATQIFPGLEQCSFDYIGTFGKIGLEGGQLTFEVFFELLAQWLSIYVYSPKRGEFVLIFSDISDRKNAENALLESEARERGRAAELQAIMDAVPAATFISRDPECRNMLSSRMTYELLRLPLGANASKSAPEHERPTTFRAMKDGREIPPEDLPVQRAASTGQAIWGCEVDLLFEDGSSSTLFGNAVPLLGDDGAPYGSVGAFVDITDRKRAEAELRHAAAALRRSNDELQQFAYVVSHDLQEPLRAITSFSKVLERRLATFNDPAVQEPLQFIASGAARMRQLIGDLLAYARVDHTVESHVEVDMDAVVGLAISNISQRIEESGATITFDALPTVRGHFGRCLQLMENLLVNAIKYRSAVAPRIHVGGSSQREQCVFSVSDNGIGIDPKYHERIFEVFKRLHSAAEYPGTGIGLAICRRIVESVGGRIWVESEIGKGSTFHFTLPCGDVGAHAAGA